MSIHHANLHPIICGTASLLLSHRDPVFRDTEYIDGKGVETRRYHISTSPYIPLFMLHHLDVTILYLQATSARTVQVRLRDGERGWVMSQLEARSGLAEAKAGLGKGYTGLRECQASLVSAHGDEVRSGLRFVIWGDRNMLQVTLDPR